MEKQINLGILGPGNIASIVVDAIKDVEGFNKYAIASRDYKKAESFATKHGYGKAFGTYEEMLADDALDLVYIATPHAFHYEHMMMCIKYKKNIICEKAFCLNKQDAEDVVKTARANSVFVCEALLTGFLPSRKIINDLLADKVIGDVKSFYGVFGNELMHVDRVITKELGGGALYDIGIYPLYFCLSTFGWNPEIKDIVLERYNDIDKGEIITLKYDNGMEAVIEACIDKNLGIYGEIHGTKGRMFIQNIARPDYIEIYDNDNQLIKRIDNLRKSSGYEYEFIACIRAINDGKFESEEMPHRDTINLLGFIDTVLAGL